MGTNQNQLLTELSQTINRLASCHAHFQAQVGRNPPYVGPNYSTRLTYEVKLAPTGLAKVEMAIQNAKAALAVLEKLNIKREVDNCGLKAK